MGCLVLYLAGAAGFDLLTDDEIRYAEAGRRMLETGDWIIPEYNGLPRYQKPILFYWLQAIGQAAFGSNVWAARLPAALAGVGVVLLTMQLGRALWGQKAGWWSGIALAVSVEMVLLSRMVMTDVVLLLFMQGAINCYCLARTGGEHIAKYSRWLYVCLGLGLLTKGPIALVLPAAVIFPWALVRGELWRTLRQLRLAEGLFILVAIAGPWYAWVHWHTDGQFTRHFLLDENLGRFTSVVNDHHQPAWFYGLLLIPMTFPWTGLIPAALRAACRAPGRSAPFRESAPWLFLWQIVLVVALFSVSKTRVWTYVLPVFPSLALLLGRWIAEQTDASNLRKLSWLFTATALAGAIATTCAPLDWLPADYRSAELLTALQASIWLLYALAAVVTILTYQATPQRALFGLAVGSAIWYLAATYIALPAYDRHWKQPVREVAEIIKTYPHAKVVVYCVHELSVNFDVGLPMVRQWREGSVDDVAELLTCKEPVFVLFPAAYRQAFERLPFHVWGECRRFVWGANRPPNAKRLVDRGTNCLDLESNP